eukprot:304038-Rhodomonas_salina.3
MCRVGLRQRVWSAGVCMFARDGIGCPGTVRAHGAYPWQRARCGTEVAYGGPGNSGQGGLFASGKCCRRVLLRSVCRSLDVSVVRVSCCHTFTSMHAHSLTPNTYTPSHTRIHPETCTHNHTTQKQTKTSRDGLGATVGGGEAEPA